MISFNPFSALTSKIFAGVAVAAIAATAVQTVRIEGAFCRSVKVGEKPACIIQGFKQQLAVVRIDLEQVRRERDAERSAHQLTKQTYAQAQAEAARLEKERLARVAAQQKEINDERAQTYQRRIDAARAAYERMRQSARGGAGAPGAADGFAGTALSAAAGAADGAAGADQLPQDERLICTIQSIRLDELQGWIREQVKVPVD